MMVVALGLLLAFFVPHGGVLLGIFVVGYAVSRHHLKRAAPHPAPALSSRPAV